nr:hypothetical protein [Tanacetum cinerariifolium]
MDYKRTQEYLPRIHRTRRMDEDLRESYRNLEKRLFYEGKIVTPSFITKNNMLLFFKVIGLEPFLTLNEPICPRFVVEFYHSLEVKRNKEQRPYVEFRLVISSSSSSSNDNEAPYFLEFYDELSDSEDLTKAQREKKGMFKCLNHYVSTITKYLEKQK